MPAKKKVAPAGAQAERRYVPQTNFTWLEYVEVDADEEALPFRAKVRKNLTNGEIEHLVWGNDTPMVELFEMFASYVVEWNVSELDADGEAVPVEPPAATGGASFNAIPTLLFFELVRDIKLRSTSPIAPKSSRLAGGTASNPSDADSSTAANGSMT